ncbi:hypothetical protein [Viscerimonas tarda]
MKSFILFMAGTQEKLLAEFEDRMKQLIALCDLLKHQNVALRDEVNEKNKIIASLSQEAGQLKTQYDNLRFAKAFASGSKDDMQNAKQRLSRLVHDVDKCIALLKI